MTPILSRAPSPRRNAGRADALIPHRHCFLLTALFTSAVSAGCVADRTPAEPDLLIPVFSHAGGYQSFGTHMTGAEETPPRPSAAQGQLVLRRLADGTLAYQLLVANILDVTQAHIHQAPPGTPGPVIVWLYPSAAPPVHIPGRFNGVLAQGVITDASVIGPLAGQGVAALLATIVAGNAYANVHTVQYPPGEIRGQVN